MEKFYTAKYDIVFKAIMVRNEEILKTILEKILHTNIDEIILLDKEISPEHFKGKSRILDMVVKSGNKVINVEVNANKEDIHNYRNAAYIFGLYNKALDKNDTYNKLKDKEFISINLNYGIYKLDNVITNVYYLQNERRKYIDNLTIIEINMDLINKYWYNLSAEEKEEFKYLKMLNMEKNELKEYCKGDAVMESFEKEINKVNEEEDYKFFLTDEEDAEKLFGSYIEIGMEQGIQQGMEQKTIESVIELSKNRVSKEIISKSLNISIEKIDNILSNN